MASLGGSKDLDSRLPVTNLELLSAASLFVFGEHALSKSVNPQPHNQELCLLALKGVFNEYQKQTSNDHFSWPGC